MSGIAKAERGVACGRRDYTGAKCAYPSCRTNNKVIEADDPVVVWDGSIDLETLFLHLHPMAKLAIQETLAGYEKSNNILFWDYVLHAPCAVEWGLHLIKDGMQVAPETGRLIRTAGANHDKR
jgi:hypothetical protein